MGAGPPRLRELVTLRLVILIVGWWLVVDVDMLKDVRVASRAREMINCVATSVSVGGSRQLFNS